MAQRIGDTMKERLYIIGLLSVFATFLFFPVHRGNASGFHPPVEILWQEEATPDTSWLVTQTITSDPQAIPSPLVFMMMVFTSFKISFSLRRYAKGL